MHKPLFCTSSAQTRALKQGGEEPETGWFIKLIGMPLDGSCRTGWMKGPPASLPPDSLRGRGREGGEGGWKKTAMAAYGRSSGAATDCNRRFNFRWPALPLHIPWRRQINALANASAHIIQ